MYMYLKKRTRASDGVTSSHPVTMVMVNMTSSHPVTMVMVNMTSSHPVTMVMVNMTSSHPVTKRYNTQHNPSFLANSLLQSVPLRKFI
jgi:hypothetical protein